MTTKQWYRALLEDQVLISPETDHSPATLLPCIVELPHTSTDWSCTWTLARSKGVGSDLTSFLFKLLHQLLPTKDRTSRIQICNSWPWCCKTARLQLKINSMHSLLVQTMISLNWHSLGMCRELSLISHQKNHFDLSLVVDMVRLNNWLVCAYCQLVLSLIGWPVLRRNKFHCLEWGPKLKEKLKLSRTRHVAAGNKMLEMISWK